MFGTIHQSKVILQSHPSIQSQMTASVNLEILFGNAISCESKEHDYSNMYPRNPIGRLTPRDSIKSWPGAAPDDDVGLDDALDDADIEAVLAVPVDPD